MRATAVLLLASLATPAFARDAGPGRSGGPCPADAPEGVRLPDRPGCRERSDPPRKAGRTPGSFELAPGTTVRIGGRTRLDYDARR
jgi:hypothetical protein